MSNTDLRQQKAIEIADKFRIVESSGKWLVPSQSGAKKYAVSVAGKTADCTCPDFETRRMECKHVLAVRITLQREFNFDGTTTVTETFEVVKKTTYPQQWTEYNKAQTNEKDLFQSLLFGLCQNVPTPVQEGKGQRTLPLSDAIFAAIFKVYAQSQDAVSCAT